MQNISDEQKDGRIISALIKIRHPSPNQFSFETPYTEERHNILWKFGSWAYAEKVQSNGMSVPINENDIIKIMPEGK